MERALILDFDRSVALEGARALDLAAWQARIRYGCSLADLARLEEFLDANGTRTARVTFLGSGDFHHVSLALIRRVVSPRPFQVVVFDNHPDNMRYPWGIHCGSWVHHVCALPFVSGVTVVGIASADVSGPHLLENHWRPLLRGKLVYLCFAKLSRVAALLPGFSDVSAAVDRRPESIAARILGASADPIYLSIDKDVLAPAAVRTNWDQGVMGDEELLGIVERLRPWIFAADVTGEISFFRHTSRWKRLLSWMDGQSLEPPSRLTELQAAHHRLNARLLDMLAPDPNVRS
jgi:hypothetical protein